VQDSDVEGSTRPLGSDAEANASVQAAHFDVLRGAGCVCRWRRPRWWWWCGIADWEHRPRRVRDGAAIWPGLSAARATVATVFIVLIGVAGGLAAAWVGVALAYRWDVRRRTVAVVARAEIIVRRDLQPPVLFGPSNNERAQLVLDRADDRVRAYEDELRALATERRWYRGDLRALAEALDTTWQAYASLVWYFTLPPDNPMRGHEPDAVGYVEEHAALGRRVAELRGRLESRLP
jgi:hypothetical protein